jgi:hypothetical protein
MERPIGTGSLVYLRLVLARAVLIVVAVGWELQQEVFWERLSPVARLAAFLERE